jgi:hypothetical protein
MSEQTYLIAKAARKTNKQLSSQRRGALATTAAGGAGVAGGAALMTANSSDLGYQHVSTGRGRYGSIHFVDEWSNPSARDDVTVRTPKAPRFMAREIKRGPQISDGKSHFNNPLKMVPTKGRFGVSTGHLDVISGWEDNKNEVLDRRRPKGEPRLSHPTRSSNLYGVKLGNRRYMATPKALRFGGGVALAGAGAFGATVGLTKLEDVRREQIKRKIAAKRRKDRA